MFGEDKLTRNERIRLESLSQALNMTAHVSEKKPTDEEILKRAEHIELWLRSASSN